MPSYRCYFLDTAGHIFTNDVIECESETEVQACADRLLAACGYPGIEVWDRERMIYNARKTDAVPGAAPHTLVTSQPAALPAKG